MPVERRLLSYLTLTKRWVYHPVSLSLDLRYKGILVKKIYEPTKTNSLLLYLLLSTFNCGSVTVNSSSICVELDETEFIKGQSYVIPFDNINKCEYKQGFIETKYTYYVTKGPLCSFRINTYNKNDQTIEKIHRNIVTRLHFLP